jgi:AraC-like DNA-binding protein/mannose-6-phosphate isomerase-like protein (cupin superfamily)
MDKITLDDCPIGNMRLEKNLNKYNISARVGEYFEFDYSKISNEHHQHDCYELVIILNGCGTFFYKNQNYLLKEGAVFLSEPDCEHEIHINQNERMTLLYIMFNINNNHDKRSLSYEEKVLDQFYMGHKNIIKDQKQLFSYIMFFEEYTSQTGSRNDYWFIRNLENFLFNCLELLVEQKPIMDGVNNVTVDLFEKALDYIDKNLSYKITADNISDNINTSKRNLYRMFKKNMGRSVNDYVNERKIYLAEYYIKMNLSVTESASLVGIENLSQFNKLFHRYLSISPRDYKTKFRNNAGGYGRRLKVSE